VLANGVRAFGTIWAAHLTSVEAATGFDHIVYGWVFFGLVMAGVLALGWRWFDRGPDDAAFDPARLQGSVRWRAELLPAALATAALAAAFPAGAAALDRAQVLPARIDLPRIAGWERVPLSVTAPWEPWYPGADHRLIGRYSDGRDAVDVVVAVYGRQAEGRELIAAGTGTLREGDRWLRVADLPSIAGGAAMRITAPGPVERVVATWYVVGDAVTADPARVKLETVRGRLTGGSPRAVAIHLSAEGQPGRDPVAAISRFLRAFGPVRDRADRWSGL
jgi:EpsI family protein